MKKFLSLLLTFAMVFSLAMPAMAAEPTVNGGTSGNVTASYTPTDTTAKITGVSITVDGETYTEGNVTITPTSTVAFTVSGTNFANLSADNYLWYAEGSGEPLNGSRWTIDTAANTATRDFSRYISDFASCNDFEVRYSNDGQQSWTGTGIYLTYDDGIAEEDKAVITSVSITVDGVTYNSGNVTITPNTQSIIYTVSGTNFANVSTDNALDYAFGRGELLNGSRWTIDTAANTATRDFSRNISDFASCNDFEVRYSNDGMQSWTGTGIYLTYDNGIAEEDKAVITSVSITVDDTKYTSGTATIAPGTQSIILTVTGTNLQNGTQDNFVMYANGSGDPVTQGRFEISDDGTSATCDLSSRKSYFEGCTTAFEIRYSNDGQATWIGSGIYVLYDDGNTTLYDVTVTDSEHGTVKAPPKSAENGQVFLTVIPDAGYQLGTLTATAGDGTTINPSDWDDGIYVFTMPAGNVTVTATFVPEDTDTTPAKITGVSITVDGETYTEGNVTITPTSTVVFTVSGTNFANLSADNLLNYAEGRGDFLNNGEWTIDPEANTATRDFSTYISHFAKCNNFEVKYSNGGNVDSAFVGTGIYLTYVKPVPDSTGKIVVDMTDSYGDGWNDAAIEVYKNGSLETTATVDQFFNTVSLDYDSTATYEFKWVTGSFDEECSFTIYVDGETKLQVQAPDAYELENGETILTLGGTATTYTVTISDAITNGTVSAAPNPAKEGDTVTVTVAAETGYAYVVNSLEVTDATGEKIEVNEDAKTFVMPASNVTVTAEFEKLSTISADIVWGSMSFTYSDDTAEWSCDAKGGDQVTVTNDGDTGFTASVAYAANEGYETLGVTGSFDTDSATLAEDASHTFTLTLSGKPNRALNGETIGSVTVTITENTAAE